MLMNPRIIGYRTKVQSRRERERERERERNRQTDRQLEREKEREEGRLEEIYNYYARLVTMNINL